MKYTIGVHTDVGIIKQTNQDSCCVKEAVTSKGSILMAVMCDGMGGLSKGEVASATLIKVFDKWFENELHDILSSPNPLEEVEHRWGRMIKEQNKNIAAYGKSLNIQLGSTITALLVLEDGNYVIGHVGDSRAYRITDEDAEVLTEDQTVVALEVKKGTISLEEAESDNRRNVLLQCVGASRIVEPVFYYGSVQDNECYMLCSDGFRHEVNSNEIFEALKPGVNNTEESIKEHLVELIELNKARNEKDNMTVIVIKTAQEV